MLNSARQTQFKKIFFQKNEQLIIFSYKQANKKKTFHPLSAQLSKQKKSCSGKKFQQAKKVPTHSKQAGASAFPQLRLFPSTTAKDFLKLIFPEERKIFPSKKTFSRRKKKSFSWRKKFWKKKFKKIQEKNLSPKNPGEKIFPKKIQEKNLSQKSRRKNLKINFI